MINQQKRRRRKCIWRDEVGRRASGLIRVPINEVFFSPSKSELRSTGVASLAASIAKHGLLQPIVIRCRGNAGGYRIVLGVRRLAACRLLGMTEIDALLLDMDEAEAAACLLEEEEVRCNLPVYLLAELIEKIGFEAMNCTYALEENKLKRLCALRGLHERTKDIIQTYDLSLEQAEPLLKIRDEQRQAEAATIIASRGLTSAQAQRLVCGPLQAAVRTSQDNGHGRRRAMRTAMEEVSQIAKNLQGQGIEATVSVHSQESGMCIQLKILKT